MCEEVALGGVVSGTGRGGGQQSLGLPPGHRPTCGRPQAAGPLPRAGRPRAASSASTCPSSVAATNGLSPRETAACQPLYHLRSRSKSLASSALLSGIGEALCSPLTYIVHHRIPSVNRCKQEFLISRCGAQPPGVAPADRASASGAGQR